MIITKKEAQRRKITQPRNCAFHLAYPDQAGVYSCKEGCVIIQDPCGCDQDMSCQECAKAR